jgi:hypothetical protein
MKKQAGRKTPLIVAFQPVRSGPRTASGTPPIVPLRHATKDELARRFAAADAQLSTLRNPAR